VGLFRGNSKPLFLLGLLAYQKKTASAFVVLLGTALSGSFLYLDHISEIAATATSLTIKVREASDALIGLRKLAALTGATLINLDAQSGVLGGDPANHRDQLKDRVLDTLRSIGVDEAAINQAETADRDRDLADYGVSIANHVRYCVLSGSRQTEWDKEVSANGWPPNPDVIQRLLEKFGVHDTFTDKALAEYRNYVATGNHQDLQFWHDRDNWPTMPKAGASSCAG
jgi:hypothetical protein